MVDAPPAARAAPDPASSYVFTRFVLLRLLALVYAVAFLILIHQQDPLIGHDGFLPGRPLPRARVRDDFGSTRAPRAACRRSSGSTPPTRPATPPRGPASGSRSPCCCGATNAVAPARALGALPLVRPDRAALLRLRLGDPALRDRLPRDLPLPGAVDPAVRGAPPPLAVIWLYRWLIARIMLGAGLIKLRGDPCWRDLTCLVYHYETQPVPNPLSWWLHAQPRWFHVGRRPPSTTSSSWARRCCCSRPRRARASPGVLFVVVPGDPDRERQPVVPELAHDRAGARLLRRRRLARARPAPRARARRRALAGAAPSRAHAGRAPRRSPRSSRCSASGRCCNLLSPRQAMNRSFDRLHLVNTYGAFGIVGRERDELILEGTDDPRSRPGRPCGAPTSSRASPATRCAGPA